MAFDRKVPEESLTFLKRRSNWGLCTRVALNAKMMEWHEKGVMRDIRMSGVAGEAGEEEQVYYFTKMGLHHGSKK